jgi:uncharacterized protein (DUF736 family)
VKPEFKQFKPLDLKPAQGKAFKNKNKETEQQPHYRGELEIPADMTGRVKIGVWINTSKAGDKYLSFIISPPFQPKGAAPASKKQDEEQFEDDDMPF